MSMWVAGASALALVWIASRRRRKPRRDTTVVVVEPAEPEPVVEPPFGRLAMIEELLDEFVSDTPRPGFFYQIRGADTLASVSRDALDSIGPHAKSARTSYMHCLQSGPNWNMRLYGTKSTTKSFPKENLVPGKGIGILVAFLPRNMDAHARMLRGELPTMTVDKKDGKPLSVPSPFVDRGLVWFPPVDEESLAEGEPTCAPFSWDDGSSTIDPPPQLLELLEPVKEAA
jgi:hypothetical protein